ncbi:MAG: uridine phosphorylase [Planctomycetota bacterium]|nr:MAG: uridine phosphorylase [Planctomycetota bacterium]
MSFESAEHVRDEDGRQYHIGVAPGEVASQVMLVGDPDRARRVSEHMDEVRVQRACREYVTFTGTRAGRELTVMGTGIGCDNTEIAVLELLECRRDITFVRVGSCGALRAGVGIGELVVSTGALRLESTSLAFVEEGYPAVAHHEVVLALLSAARQQGATHHAGITAAASGFYGWQARKGLAVEPRFPDLPERLARQGVVNMEMETSTLFTLASAAGVRAGAVCTVFANRPENRFIEPDEKHAAEGRAIDVGLGALDQLAAMDAARGEAPFFTLPAPD